MVCSLSHCYRDRDNGAGLERPPIHGLTARQEQTEKEYRGLGSIHDHSPTTVNLE